MEKKKVQSVIFYTAANNKKQFLLLRMNARRKLYWQNVTGSLDMHESFKNAARRESIEETGLQTSNIKSITESELEFAFFDQWKKNVIEKVFIIECFSKWDVRLDPSEHSEFKWESEDEISSSSVHFDSNFQALKIALELK